MRNIFTHRNVATALALVAAGLATALLLVALGQSRPAGAQTARGHDGLDYFLNELVEQYETGAFTAKEPLEKHSWTRKSS